MNEYKEPRITKQHIQTALNRLQDKLGLEYPLKFTRGYIEKQTGWINSVHTRENGDTFMSHFCGFYDQPIDNRRVLLAIEFANSMVSKAYKQIWYMLLNNEKWEIEEFLRRRRWR